MFYAFADSRARRPVVYRPVVDKTGLPGLYQFKVELDANQSAVRGLLSSGITNAIGGRPINQPMGVSTFKAVESLGLKLESRRVPLAFIIVEQIERSPTPD